MPTDLERPLARFAEVIDREAPTISFDDVVGRGTVSVDLDLLEGLSSDGASTVEGAWSDTTPNHDEIGERDGLIELTPAPVVRRPAWRRVSLRVALGAAAVAVLVVSLAAIERGGDEVDPADDFPTLTTTFVSPRNGFSIKHPDGVAVTPAKQIWFGGTRQQVDDGFDVVETGSGAVFRGTTSASEFPDPDADSCHEGPTGEEVPCGTIDEQVDRYLAFEPLQFDGCGVPRSTQAEITIDGQSGRVAECPNHVEATVVTGGRLYVFILSHDRDDARAVFDAFAATIDLTPETAVSFAAMTTTFVSPTYGLSFKHFDRGGDTPATYPWDPVNEPGVREGRFDEVETGSGAIFEAASTVIPNGVSIDAWVDEYVTPTAAEACGVPRSTQAEITIDGQPGRTADCANRVNRVEATVVAGRRLYLFVMWHQRSDARAWFDAWIATIDLTPETATVP
jgi:hypothetical protein